MIILTRISFHSEWQSSVKPLVGRPFLLSWIGIISPAGTPDTLRDNSTETYADGQMLAGTHLAKIINYCI